MTPLLGEDLLSIAGVPCKFFHEEEAGRPSCEIRKVVLWVLGTGTAVAQGRRVFCDGRYGFGGHERVVLD